MKRLAMNTLLTATILGSLSLSTAFADDAQEMEESVFSSTTEVTANVKNIDYKTRKITLEDELGGETVSFLAGEDVENLDKIKKGDSVKVTYHEALAYTVHKGGEVKQAQEEVKSKKAGDLPGGEASRKITATVKITKIDKKEPSVTFKSAKGETHTVKVKHPERLEGVNVGDTVDLTYSEALAVKIEKQSKI